MDPSSKFFSPANPRRKLGSLSSNHSPPEINSNSPTRKPLLPSLKPIPNPTKQQRYSILALNNPKSFSKSPPKRQKTTTDSVLPQNSVKVTQKIELVDEDGEELVVSEQSFEDLQEKKVFVGRREKKAKSNIPSRFLPVGQLRPQMKKPQIQQMLNGFGKDLNKVLEGKMLKRKEGFNCGYGKMEMMGGSWEDQYENVEMEGDEYSQRERNLVYSLF